MWLRLGALGFMTKTFEIKMVEKVTYKLIDENISVVQKTVLLETSRIQKKVLEHQEKEVTHWPLLICKKIGLPNSVNGILQ